MDIYIFGLSHRSTLIWVDFVASIPPFTLSGVLPPYIGNPTQGPLMAPFQVSINDVVDRFGTSESRLQLLDGFLRYRQALSTVGLTDGFQWIDGSFAEDVETIEGRDPRDIDVVTFFRRPIAVRSVTDWPPFVMANVHLFDTRTIKLAYHCDSFFVDVDAANPFSLIDQTRFWFGLFSHRRTSNLWKGMLQVPLAVTPSDTQAIGLIAQRRGYP